MVSERMINVFDYKEKMPSTDYTSQLEFLKKHNVDSPDCFLDKYRIISTRVCCFKHCLEDEFKQYYECLPTTEIKGVSVDGNRTTCFFIVMSKSWWDYMEKIHSGDLNVYVKYQGNRMTFC